MVLKTLETIQIIKNQAMPSTLRDYRLVILNFGNPEIILVFFFS